MPKIDLRGVLEALGPKTVARNKLERCWVCQEVLGYGNEMDYGLHGGGTSTLQAQKLHDALFVTLKNNLTLSEEKKKQLKGCQRCSGEL